MKKIFTYIIMALLLSCAVFAQGNGKQLLQDNDKPIGLQNAMFRVTNEKAQEVLMGNFERFRNRHQEKFMGCQENCSIDIETGTRAIETYTATVQRQSKLLGFDVNDVEEFEFDADGNKIRESRNIWARLRGIGLAK